MGFLKTAAALSCSLPAVLAKVPSIQGYSLTWSDDFEGAAGSAPSGDWQFDTGTSYPGAAANWGTGEIESYTTDSSNIGLTGNGSLAITPVLNAGAWTSARIETVPDNFTAESGSKMIIQASIKMPSITGDQAIGYWPAFWAMGSAFRGNYWNWPGIGEFDIMENVNGLDWVSGTFHCGVDPGGACNETDGLSGQIACPGSACQGNYHTYSITVDRSASPETLTWAVDGQSYHTVSENDVGNGTTWSAAVDDTKFILLNVAIGGSYPNKVYQATTPVDATVGGYAMYVDYVAVYNAN